MMYLFLMINCFRRLVVSFLLLCGANGGIDGNLLLCGANGGTGGIFYCIAVVFWTSHWDCPFLRRRRFSHRRRRSYVSFFLRWSFILPPYESGFLLVSLHV